MKSMVYPPLLSQWDALDAVVDPQLADLMAGPPSVVPRRARQTDRSSRPVLAPAQSSSATSSPSAG